MCVCVCVCFFGVWIGSVWTTSIQFSKEPNNLYNLNSYKHSGLTLFFSLPIILFDFWESFASYMVLISVGISFVLSCCCCVCLGIEKMDGEQWENVGKGVFFIWELCLVGRLFDCEVMIGWFFVVWFLRVFSFGTKAWLGFE